MSSKTMGLIVAAVGLVGVLVFALADVLGIGSHPGIFGIRQIIGTAVGVVLLVAGAVVYLRAK